MLSNINILSTIKYKKWVETAVAALLFSFLIYLPDLFFFKNGVYNYAIAGVAIVTVLLIPVVLFFYNLKICYFILALIAVCMPITLPVLLINNTPNEQE